MSSSASFSLKIKIALIGSGLIGPRHGQSIISNSSLRLIALVDPAPYGISVAKSLNTTHYASVDLLLSSSDRPEAAVICTPNHTHVSLTLQLIEAGIHVLVEKPLCTNIEDGLLLLEAVKVAKEKGVRVLVGHHRRFNPYLLAAKSALERRLIGKVVAMQGIWALKKNKEYFNDVGEWRRDAKTGGPILINLIHEIDLLQYLLGPITLVSAIGTKKERDFDAEEGAAILLRFQAGMVGTFILSDNTPSPWNFEGGTGENPMIPQTSPYDLVGGFYRILGAKGSLSVPDLTVWNGEWTQELVMQRSKVEKDKVPFDVQMEHFVKVVNGEVESNCTVEEALSAMVVCEGIKKAVTMGDGKPIMIRGFDIVGNGIKDSKLSML
jgi:predicted dehydrogenase